VFPSKPDDEFKAYAYEQFSRIGKALSSPQRLIILNILCQGEHTVEALARYSGQSVANTSRHLQHLKSVNLVKLKRSGKNIFYSIRDEAACNFYMSLKEFASNQLGEIRTTLEEISSSPSRSHSVSREELLKMVTRGNAVVIDVRPEEEFQQAHLPGAISIPLEELEKRIEELPRDKTIVAYCRGRYCILADKAVEVLLKKGYRAGRIDESVIEWKNAGLPIEES